MKWLKKYLATQKMKFALRWISEAPGLKIVRIERRGRTDYIVSQEGQFWKLSK